MQAIRSTLGNPVNRWLRICLHSSLIIGIFAMHHMLVGQDERSGMHHLEVASAAAVTHSVSQLGDLPAPFHGDGDTHGTAADCCGIMMVCLTMIIGIGAFVLIRRASGRVLWQLPPPLRFGISLCVPPFHALSPLERTSVLRC